MTQDLRKLGSILPLFCKTGCERRPVDSPQAAGQVFLSFTMECTGGGGGEQSSEGWAFWYLVGDAHVPAFHRRNVGKVGRSHELGMKPQLVTGQLGSPVKP